MMSEQKWTLLELLNWTTEYFKEAEIENPRLNAELLLSEVTGMERVMLYAHFEDVASPPVRKEFRRLVRERAFRQPLQYLLGRAEFYGRELKVTPGVLIPRPETELVIDKCLEKIPVACASDFRIADLGTGSGAIAVTLACERENAVIYAVDNSEAALRVARDNAEKLGVAGRIDFLEGNICEPLRKADGAIAPLNMIVSNPPYIPTNRIEKLQPEVRDWEPKAALDGGDDGLDIVRMIVASAPEHLGESGWLVMELGERQAGDVREVIGKHPALDEGTIEIVRDGTGCERVIAVQKMQY